VATSRQAQYFSKEGRLVLSGDVDVVDRDGQRIRAERLVYLLDSERVVAASCVCKRARGLRPPPWFHESGLGSGHDHIGRKALGAWRQSRTQSRRSCGTAGT
jgi:hypothetical protein